MVGLRARLVVKGLLQVLLLLHLNDLTDAINCKSNPSADDTVVIIAKKSAEELESKLNIKLSKAGIWLYSNLAIWIWLT